MLLHLIAALAEKVCGFRLQTLLDISNSFHENLQGTSATLILQLHLVNRNLAKQWKRPVFILQWYSMSEQLDSLSHLASVCD